ncbi:helix-turn-helix domain-containing protein [Nocardiopsis suaedae]|uniref:Helix-turn-helix transcriptional regulator n=1 Tax=Nocardiopsis suaedae TaxID=3018444 RepID=A0ABT4TP62_9ACTN|nr:helix-turn-helix transcriptional regulator [Nocardiopsis suaedae]MDA2806470.1 helix-turn-helix transcriptional regulator [Nocardiopsis suaedae]
MTTSREAGPAAADRLGDFLRARRERLRPEDAGSAALPGRRRVAGLRREELALLAGVSVSYYTRLEQGHAANASDAVLDAIARALRLDEHEAEHLRELAARRPRRLERPAPERVDSPTHDLLRSLGDVPAMVLGRRTDVLAWNPMARALLAGHLDPAAPDRCEEPPNLARMLFLDPHTRDLYVDWERKARAVVGSLRLVAGRHPEDGVLASLVGELSVQSEEFAELWSDRRVKPCEADRYRLRHPLVGELTVAQQVFAVARSPEQSLVVVTTEEGSSAADSLKLLSRFAEPDSAER